MASKKAPEPAQLDIEAKVIELRRAGLTWQVIAERTGFSGPSGAYKAYQRAAERTIRPNLDEHRDTELDRLDRLQATVWGKALNGDLKAIETVLRIIDRRTRILGLEAPKDIHLKADVNTYDRNSIDDEVARLVALLDGGKTGAMDTPVGENGTNTN